MKHKILITLLLFVTSLVAQNKNQSVGFKENKGQIIDQKGKPNPDVKYLLNTNGLNVQIKTNSFSYDIYETKKHPIKHNKKEKQLSSTYPETNKEKSPDYTLEYIYHRIDIDFVNSNPKVELVTEQKSKDYDNYYNIPNKPDGVLIVHQYQQITYKNIYPNIDVVFSIPKDSLKAVEYNFVVHPKGKISDIKLKFNGAKTELVDNKIKMQVRFGEMEETLPMSWTEDGKNKKEIAVVYTKIKKDVYGFESNENVSNKTVIIDPVPVRLWGTYYGGEGIEFSSSVFAKDGIVYWAGTTYSSRNIASSGAYQNYYSSGWDYDCFFTKLNSDGTRVWGTYYGGGYADRINQIKASDNENVYIVGSSLSSTNISSPGSHQPQKGLYWDGFLAKFDTNGIREWATYYGGEDNEEVHSLCIDSNGKIYISGETISGNNIATIASHQPNHANQGADSYDGFIAKFSSNGVREWGTYYGGNSRDAILDSKLDSSGNLIFLGITNSTIGISTSNAYQEINNGADGFLVKFDPNGNRVWGTYFGGNNDDFFFNLGIDSSDNLYCFGQTNSTINIATTGVFQEVYQQNNLNLDGCIFKFNPNGFKTWGTYFSPGAYGGSVSKNGAIYFAGIVENGFEATPNAFQEQRLSNNSGSDGYLVKFNTNGQREWATYFSGEMAEYTNITAVDDNFNIYLAGSTNSLTNIATPNTYQPNFYYVPFTDNNHLNSQDAFLVKFKDCFSSTTASSNSPICEGKTLELKANGGTNYDWSGPNGFTSVLQNPTIPNATAANSGQYSCAITGTGDCDDTKIIEVIVGDTVAPVPNLAMLTTIIGDCKTQITTIPTATDACTGAIIATTTSPLSYSLSGTYTIVWNYNDGNGNSVTQNQTVTISNQPLPTSTSPQLFCIQENATLNSISITGQNIKWYDALANGNLLDNTTPLQNGITYYASQTINGCESERTPVLINIQNAATPTAISPQTFCASQNPTLNNLVIAGTNIKWYDNSTLRTVLPISTPLQNGQTYYATQTLNGCESPTRLAVTVTLISTLPANNYAELFCDDLNDGMEAVNLSSYNSSIISKTTDYSFTYFNSLSGAENEMANDKIANFTSYKLVVGDNKIYVRINSNTPCYAVAEIKLTLFSKPIINIQDIVPICENNTITINAGAGFDSYLWSNGATTQSITVANPENFSVTVTDDHDTISCSSTKNFTVKKSNKATINNIETKDWTDNDNVITVFATGNGEYEYSIDGFNYQTSNQFTGLNSGKYTVLVRDKNGCGTATNEVYLLMFPRFFTPNGDGYNDTWKIKFSDIEAGLTVKIFDRYGKIIKILSANTDSWDGTYNGTELSATDYWFVVTRANGIEYKGHFSLKR
jgi:gliding motility-associated-like protein